MANNKRLCINCEAPMEKIYVTYRGIKLEARQCPKCKEKIFTEDLTMKAINKLEAKRMEEEYIKHPIKIGHSWGMTFPKEVTDVFNLDNPAIKLRIHPNLDKDKIEILLK